MKRFMRFFHKKTNKETHLEELTGKFSKDTIILTKLFRKINSNTYETLLKHSQNPNCTIRYVKEDIDATTSILLDYRNLHRNKRDDFFYRRVIEMTNRVNRWKEIIHESTDICHSGTDRYIRDINETFIDFEENIPSLKHFGVDEKEEEIK